MKRLALVTPLYGKEATGSTAAYARRLAELLTQHYQVDVLTTRAIDAESWKNWYVRTVETVQGVRIRRFSVTHPKTLDFSTFDQQYQKQLEETGPDPAQEKSGLKSTVPAARTASPISRKITIAIRRFCS